MKSKSVLTTVILALSLAGTAAAEAPKFSGGLLVDAQGMTLYTFDKDAQGKSNCHGGCLAAWPAALAAADETALGEFSLIVREDGGRQWAFKGWPLYRYAADTRPGDMAGDNQGSVWHVVRTGRAAQISPASAPRGYSNY